MDKIPQKGMINTSSAAPDKRVVLGVPQKKPDEVKEKTDFNKEHLPETNKVLEPTMSMESVPEFGLSHEPAQRTAPISIKKTPIVETVPETQNALIEEKPISGDISDIPTLRTYKKDVANTITSQKTSLVRMVLEEQKSRQRKAEETSPRTRKNLSLIVFSVIFFLATLGVVYYAFFRVPQTSRIFTDLNTTPLFNTEVSQEFSFDGKSKKDIAAQIEQEITGTNPRLDTIKNIFFTGTDTIQTANGPVTKKKLVTAPELFEKMEIPVPLVLLRTIKNDFMFGYHAFNGNQPFLVLETDYYDNAFSGMLNWENTMSVDLQPLFGVIGTEDLSQRTWSDVVTKNKDTRVLNNFDGSVALVYMFKDKGTLIITTNNNTLLEISRRLDLAVQKSGI